VLNLSYRYQFQVLHALENLLKALCCFDEDWSDLVPPRLFLPRLFILISLDELSVDNGELQNIINGLLDLLALSSIVSQCVNFIKVFRIEILNDSIGLFTAFSDFNYHPLIHLIMKNVIHDPIGKRK